MALEHPNNTENFSLEEKIRMAVFRYNQGGNFFESEFNLGPVFYIFLEKIRFNKEKIGYDVIAKIPKSGDKMLKTKGYLLKNKG